LAVLAKPAFRPKKALSLPEVLAFPDPDPKNELFAPPDVLKPALFPKNEFEQKILSRTSLLQYLTFQFFAVSVLLALPVKLILRLALTIKYVWVTPWFNI